jgi:hypothetical protein
LLLRLILNRLPLPVGVIGAPFRAEPIPLPVGVIGAPFRAEPIPLPVGVIGAPFRAEPIPLPVGVIGAIPLPVGVIGAPISQTCHLVPKRAPISLSAYQWANHGQTIGAADHRRLPLASGADQP